ncbi:MAG TPA: protocatechuate 3,4-dioxygenase subunit beta [Alphaproteobacteria bacterium]
MPTAHQTTGPFFPAQYIRPGDTDLAGVTRQGPPALGEPYYIHGHVRDAAAKPAVNVILEIWQANAAGRFHHPVDRSPAPLDPHFVGWGRTWTDRDGFYSFITIKPGPYPVRPGGKGWFAPRINVRLIGSGLMRPLITCLYFPNEPLNEDDPQLVAISNAAARRRLIATPEPHDAAPAGVKPLRFDLDLGGRQTSTFLDD